VIIGSIVAFVVTVVAVVGVTLVAIPALEVDAKPTGDPAVFVKQVVRYIVADDYTSAWGSLYPAHQRVARQTEYVGCEMQRPVSSTLGSIDVLRVSDRKLRIPGQSGRADVKAVTLRINLQNALGAKETFKHTFNAVPSGSEWTWILTPSRYRLYRDDSCTTA
jgi:hypothetical protein